MYEPVCIGGRPAVGFGGPFDVLEDIVTAPVKAVAGAAKATFRTVTEAADAIAKATSSIPVLGDVTRIVGDAASAPARLATSIASGARIDKAIVKSVKDQVRIAREAAPYAQMVVSVVPGAGTGVAAAIGAGVALSEGKGIDDLAKEAIKGALPGGPIAAAGFEAAMSVAEGKELDEIAIASARELVPDGPGRKAFDTAVAVATGENIQNALARGFADMAQAQLLDVARDWVKKAAKSPEIMKALSAIPKDAQPGYALAMGVLKHEGINQKAVAAARRRIGAKAKEGFDLALKAEAKKLPWLRDVLSPPKQPARTKPVAKAPSPRPPQLRSTPSPAKAPVKAPPTLKARVPEPPKAPAKAPPTLKSKAPAAKAKAPAAPKLKLAAPRGSASAITPGHYGPYPAMPHGLSASSSTRYFFWYVFKDGQYVTAVGPQSLTDYDAFLVEERTKVRHFGSELYRFVWQPGMPAWLYDARTTHELHAGIPPRTSGAAA